MSAPASPAKAAQRLKTETDERAMDAGFDEEARQPRSDANDPDPDDPNGPEVAFQPRPL